MAAVDERANLRHLGDMEVVAVAELGRKKMRLKQVRQLRRETSSRWRDWPARRFRSR